MRKKIVWLPYDFDTAIGINNEGALVFDYALEDVDHLEGGADVFNGQESVVWKNIRNAFGNQLAEMYRTLRSTGALSYDKVEQMFEQHQAKWPESIFNEDAWFKYIDPLVNDGSGAYLSMLQGSKAEQRKWWLYNRFRYIDSKYNAGDALSDLIQVRGYAKANITVTPYADIYPTVKYGSYLVSERGHRNVATTLVCPLDNVNDTEIYIYSASQLASVGDLSGLLVGFADFSMATKLQSLKIGDSSSNYNNGNLKELYLGNNVLLQTIDVRNCTALGTGDQKAVDISGCSNIENVYFDGTAITGLTLPNGGILKVLHLPATITNLTIMNQKSLTDVTIAGYNNISTLRLENLVGMDTLATLRAIPTGSRVRLIGVAWEADDAEEISDIFDLLDSMRGLDESGNNVEKAQLSGTIHTNSLTGTEIEDFNSRYPYVNVIADHTTTTLTYKTWNGESTIKTVTCVDGVPQEAAPSVPARTATAQYTFTAAGWNTTQDASVDDPSAITNVNANRVVYAAYSRVVNTYTVYWKNNGTTIRTDTNVAYGTKPVWGQAMPTNDGQTATGWDYDLDVGIVGNTTINAKYTPQYTATFVLAAEDSSTGSQYTLKTIKFDEGSIPSYTGETPTTAQGDTTEFTFTGWSPEFAPIYTNTTYTAQFQDNRALTIQYLTRNISAYESNSNTTIATYGLAYATKLTTVTVPATTIESYAFYGDSALEVVDLSATSSTVTISANAFNGCSGLTHVIIRSNTMATLSNSNVFGGTKIATGFGAIYVPTNLIATYKANANWKNYYIADINDYPLNDFSTIKDSWDTIIANNNYDNDYVIGDTKTLDLGSEGKYKMVLVAKDTDDKADGSGKARMTWISNTMLPIIQMNSTSTTTGGWESSEMRTYLKDTIKPLIPENVRNAIVPVTKISSTYSSAVVKNGQTTTDDVWIPSDYEIGASTTYEDTGARYNTYFTNTTSRIKYLGSSTNSWWLRSVYSESKFRYVNSSGGASTTGANNWEGVVLGFCI